MRRMRGQVALRQGDSSGRALQSMVSVYYAWAQYAAAQAGDALQSHITVHILNYTVQVQPCWPA